MVATTGEASHISCRNAVLAGKANLPANTSTDLKIGILYATSEGVLFGSATAIEAKSFDGEFNYSIVTDILEPETTYYYRGYILQKNEITYGDTKSFTTLPVSSMIETGEVTDIEAAVATLHAKLDLTDCKYDALEYGFKLMPQGGQETTVRSNDLSSKVFSAKAEGLSREKEYEVAAYVTLDGKTYQGEKKHFSTQTIQAIISLNDATNITELKATVSGKLTVTSQGSFEKTAKLFYSPTAQAASVLQSSGTGVTLSLSSDGSFSQSLTDLTPNGTYYYVVVATVDGVGFASEVKSFKTANFTAEVTTQAASNVIYKTATLNGFLSVTSIESLTKEVWFLYSETASTVDELRATGTKVSSTVSGGSFTAGLTGLKDQTTYSYVAGAKVQDRIIYGAVNTFTTALPAGAVNMGLSVLWHQCNIGATKPEEYGDYYAWGETTTKSTYNWSTYTLCGGSETWITKYGVSSTYGITDNKTVLEKADDVAYQKFGGNWRMPTASEWDELLNTDNCTWSWTQLSGVNGCLVTSKKTGNSIFLPAAGDREEDDLCHAGYYGLYWSSSLDTRRPAGALGFFLKSSDVGWSYYGYRYQGRSVRPVYD